MTNVLAVVHILLAVSLIILVLVQDSKGGGALGIGGSGSNSLLGATGAQTLAAKMTRIIAGLFAISCLYLSVTANQGSKSVLDATAATATANPAPPSNVNGAATTGTTLPTTSTTGPVTTTTTLPTK